MNLLKNKSSNPANPKAGLWSWIAFLGAAFVILILSPLFQKGCFLDGMLYKTVAYNYANGLSSFWQMKFTDTSMAQFCEQPPLYFFLLGNFYHLFGGQYLVDRFFTLLLFILLVYLLHRIARELFRNASLFLLLTVFFMLAIPVFCWSYVNQVIEPLLCVLTAFGLLFFIKFLNSKQAHYLILFGLSLCLLFITKGFQSCFIIGLPIVYTCLTRFKKPELIFSLSTGLILLGFIVFVLKFYGPAKNWFDCYYTARLVLTMQNVGNTTDNHFEIIGRFFSELIVCLGVLVLGISYLKIKKKYPLKFVLKNFLSDKLAVSLLITSFLGSFPYALSLVQRGFYLIPSFTCFVLALVYGLKRYWLYFFSLLSAIGQKKFVRLSFLFVFLGSLFFFILNFSSYKRNAELLTDLELLEPYLKNKEIVLIGEERWNDFSLHSYLYMDKQISLSRDKKDALFLIQSKSATLQDSAFHKIKLNTKEIDLFVR